MCVSVCMCTCRAACAACPAGTEPVLGYEYKWWNVLPSNMKTSCFNVGNSKCDNMNGESREVPAGGARGQIATIFFSTSCFYLPGPKVAAEFVVQNLAAPQSKKLTSCSTEERKQCFERSSKVPPSCVMSSGWEVAGDHIRSGTGSSDNDYLILTLHVPGFK